jgi:DNA (cytosine-5)-methyltransferase 1
VRKNEIVVDSFAGGGGASLGICWALEREPEIAVNHDEAALRMHAANHPTTRHVREDVWQADLKQLIGKKKVGLLWASPDCKHFSAARGSKPVAKSIRSLAWIVCKWAAVVKPRVIVLENVREFADWGPTMPRFKCRRCDWAGTEGQAAMLRKRPACPRCNSVRLQQTTQEVPNPDKKGLTFRRWVGRLRSLGYTVDWRVLNASSFGSPTNRRRLFVIARRDGELIYWPSETHGDPKKIGKHPELSHLKPWRTVASCIDWSLPCQSIFDRKRPLAEKTMRRIALGMKRYVLDSEEPYIVRCNHGGDHFRGQSVDSPMCTLTCSRDAHGLVVPILSAYHHSKTENDDRCHVPNEPAKTLDTQPRFALVAAFLAKHFGGVVGVPVTDPSPTTMSKGAQNQLVAASMVHLNHGEKQWSSVVDPARTATTGRHAALVYSFMVKYFGTSIGASVIDPAPTATTKDRFGLVTVTVAGEPYVIVDIGMRMLTPRELATAQGFPADYVLTGTKTSQVARIGNSVCPQVAEAVVRANLAPLKSKSRQKEKPCLR